MQSCFYLLFISTLSKRPVLRAQWLEHWDVQNLTNTFNHLVIRYTPIFAVHLLLIEGCIGKKHIRSEKSVVFRIKYSTKFQFRSVTGLPRQHTHRMKNIHLGKRQGLKFNPETELLSVRGFSIFSLCLRGFPLGSLVSSYLTKKLASQSHGWFTAPFPFPFSSLCMHHFGL